MNEPKTITEWLNEEESYRSHAKLSRHEIAWCRTLLENETRDMERTLQRYEAFIDSVQMLAWPDATDEQCDGPEFLVKLATKVGQLVRSQGWEVERKHVVANVKLARMVHELRAEVRRERALDDMRLARLRAVVKKHEAAANRSLNRLDPMGMSQEEYQRHLNRLGY